MSGEIREETTNDNELSEVTLEMNNVEGDRYLETLFSELNNWAQSLSRRTARIPPLIKIILESNEELSDEFPSKATAAAMELRQIERALEEANNAFRLVHNHIFENYSDSIQADALHKHAAS